MGGSTNNIEFPLTMTFDAQVPVRKVADSPRSEKRREAAGLSGVVGWAPKEPSEGQGRASKAGNKERAGLRRERSRSTASQGTEDAFAQANNFARADQTIKAHCAQDWPTDFHMQEFCRKQQRESLDLLKQGRPRDIDLATFKIIRTECASQWKDDYHMWQFCESQQYDAVRALEELGRSTPSGVTREQYGVIEANCAADWPADFNMRLFCMRQQIEAARALR